MNIATSKNLTILGIITIVQALAVAATAMFDGDPTTVADFGSLLTAIMSGVGLILAKGAQSTGGTVDGAGKPVAP